MFSLVTLVLALGGPRRLVLPSASADQAAQLAALHWWRGLRLGELPERIQVPDEFAHWGRLPVQEVQRRIEDDPAAADLGHAWTLTGTAAFALMLPAPPSERTTYAGTAQPIDHERAFAQALVDNAKQALGMRHDAGLGARTGHQSNSVAAQARRWLIAHYPLLGSLLTQLDVIEDAALCGRMRIQIAAINTGLGEIYINPTRPLSLDNAKFVLAHEALHAGLGHSQRRQGRDPFLWNVACDFVINDWLVQMSVGMPPGDGLLYDEELRGWSADDIYLRLAADLRVRRRLLTLRGDDVDLLDSNADASFTDREEFYRRALLQGLDWHAGGGRGLLPAGLVEEIRSLSQPPIAWQAKLAQWLRERFALPQRQRTYARPSRRQSTTPDIARPRFFEPDEDRATRTFAVVLDTSGSMSREALGKAIGAVASYAQAQGVRQVRVVYCDAHPYDEGYIPIEALAGRIAVRGRGGTLLQPAISLIETRTDFPKDGPILIITDGDCEGDLRVLRDHAFLLTSGRRLPFPTRMPVFMMEINPPLRASRAPQGATP